MLKKEKDKLYLTRPEGNCWVGRKMSEGKNMKMVSRYNQEMIFCCEYDGESLGDEFETTDIDKALEWLYKDTIISKEEWDYVAAIGS